MVSFVLGPAGEVLEYKTRLGNTRQPDYLQVVLTRPASTQCRTCVGVSKIQIDFLRCFK